MKSGIGFGGNILADVVKTIDGFPKVGMLTNITAVSRAVGGCVPNTAMDLAKMDPAIPLYAYGRVGDDDTGQFVVREMETCGIDTAGVLPTPGVPTSFSDVMSDRLTGERTFFHARGANARFGPEDVDPDRLTCRIFHMGYILLLDQMDESDPVYGTKMAGLLASIQAKGIKTSIDVVSDSAGLFREKTVPALRYTDYAIMNEIEACGTAGLDPRRDDGSLHEDHVRAAMEAMLLCGVGDRVIVHSKEAGFMLKKDGTFFRENSLHIPPEKIAGSVGAGDAFCAACLYALYTGMPDKQILSFAAAAALCCLTKPDSVSGMRTAGEIRQIAAAGGL